MVPQGSEMYMLNLSENQHALWAVGPLAADNLPAKHRYFGATPQPVDIRFMVCQLLEWMVSYEINWLELIESKISLS